MSSFRRILLNPFVLLLPVLFLIGAVYYLYAPNLSAVVTSTHNILPNSDFFHRNSDGLPTGWQLFPHIPGVTFTTPAGYTNRPSLRVENTTPRPEGNITITSPEAQVLKGHTYFYKSYYKASAPFDLIVQETDDKGLVTRTIMSRHPASQEWATASAAMTAGASVRSIRFVYSLSGSGAIHLSDTHLQADPQDVAPPKEPSLQQNSIPELRSNEPDSETPARWNTFSSGTNTAKFTSVTQATDAPYIRTEVSDYKNGEAKWQHDPAPVSPGDYSRFSVAYKSDKPADVVAEYLLRTGERRFVTLATLLPAVDWTTYRSYLTAPADASSVTVSVVLKSSGTLDTKEYSLRHISTTDDARAWKRPIVSYAFDDGWLSAHQQGASLLRKANHKATFYINPSSIDTPGFMTTADVADLNGSGHELASHGYEHIDLTMLGHAELDYQLRHANDYFRQVFGMQSVNFAAPLGRSDAQLAFYARKHYASMRSTQDGINVKQSFDPYDLRVLYVGKDMPLSRLKETLTETRAAHGWLILVYHRIEDDAEGDTAVTPKQFQSHIDTVQDSDITVMTVNKALQEIKQQ